MNRVTSTIVAIDDQRLRDMVDALITPENADREVTILHQLLLIGSDDDGRRKILEYAFSKTSEFEAGFERFLRPRPTISVTSRSLNETEFSM